MKKQNIILILLSICLLSSCDDGFLNRNSLVGLSEGGFWTTQENAILGTNSLYHANREFTNNIVIYGMMDDFSDISYHSLNIGLTTGSYPANAGFFLNSWGIFYKGIYRANTALKYIPDITMDSQIKDRCLGESKFFRGYFYFKLWDYFGGVPIYDFPMNPSEAYKPRDTEKDVYEFIVKDMTDAYALLPASYTGTDIGRATKWAALAMRGKAHLWAKEYAKAAADFKELMEKSDRELLDDYHTLFRVAGNNNSEVIFDVQYIEEAGHGIQTDRAYGASTSSNATSASQYTRPTNELVNSYEMIDGAPFDFSNFTNAKGEPFDPNVAENWHDEASVKRLFENRDPRLQQSIIVPWSTFVGKGDVVFTYRFPVTSAPDSYQIVWQNGSYAWRKFVETGSVYSLRLYTPQNIPLIRLADVMLMYAEAQNEALSSPDQSVYDAVNAVRNRAGMPGLPTGLNKDQMRERIRHERKIELCGEGQRYSDIRRWRIAKNLLDGVWMREFTGTQGRHQRGFPDHFYLWAIPQQEITLNPELKQNPGWE
ncbi:SusD domain protein [Proteiniphilum saccharofermentans]|uniref:SusD domain protein n=1 Tax=Proteiniphilum saccharofermentans TaxID=1642647 RepID=A0A1R3T5A7_9BACT|nr:RagB/SusD family nutrient uptake outer membrane protein [Proteiniphilum saccharofermentans]SCD19145.1 SusD domain protein [Proteiniphilum saccharofermentans]SDZ73389.1 Starch-binding associating with outer membrane [Porphyromonadaceae bacterium KH3R12]SFL28822.1 Starch-binding associating with outer membrane [Porphyromonadaceae bacterium KH3CP3RA]